MQIEHARRHLGRHRDPCGGYCTADPSVRIGTPVHKYRPLSEHCRRDSYSRLKRKGRDGGVIWGTWSDRRHFVRWLVTVLISGASSSPHVN